MAKKKTKPKKNAAEQVQRPKDFLDMIAPAAVKFNTDHFILGSRYHTAMALKSYPPMTDELALLRGLGDMGGVNLRLDGTAGHPCRGGRHPPCRHQQKPHGAEQHQ